MRYQKGTAPMSLAVFVSLMGCRAHTGPLDIDRCAQIPCGAIPQSAGVHVCEWQNAQVTAAAADQGVFYQADFVDHSDRLSPAAELRMTQLVQREAIGKIPIVLETSGDPHRDQMRVNAISTALQFRGIAIAPEHILIGTPPALGLDGYRAQQVARTASRSGSQQGGQGGQGGFGQGGFGAGGGASFGGMGMGGIF